MEFLKSKTMVRLFIALGLILISGIFASMLQSDFYRVEVQDIREDFGDGVQYSALLYKPNDASADNPLPAIVLSHGYLNNRELQAQNAVELSRRGFIVLTVDRLGHGHSALPDGVNNPLTGDQTGMVNAVEWLHAKDYVDKDMIGISGHSMGGFDTAMTLVHYAQKEGEAIQNYYADNGIDPDDATQEEMMNALAAGAEANKIGAALIQAWSSFYAAPMNTPVGNLAGKYDEFFYKESTPGSDESEHNASLDPNDPNYSNDMKYEYLPKDFLESPTGTAFIQGIYGDFSASAVESGTFYTASGPANFSAENPADEAFRVIYQPNEIHPRNHFSRESAEYIVDFFYASFGTPEGFDVVEASSMRWPVKEFFNLVGLVGFFFLLLPLTDLLLKSSLFKSLKGEPKEPGELSGWPRYVQFLGTGAIITLLAGFLIRYFYSDAYGWGTHFFPITERFPQPTTNPVVVWATAIGLISLALYFIGYLIVGKKAGDEPGTVTRITGKNFGKTILLAFSIVGGLYLVLFIVHGLFTTDFRIWTFNIRTFENIKVATMLRYALLLSIYFTINAFIIANSRFKNLPEWATTAIMATFNVFGIVLVMLIQYLTFFNTGALWQWDMALGYIVLFPIVPVLILAAIFSRQLYLRTGNIWLSGFVNALLFTAIMVANTATNFNYILF